MSAYAKALVPLAVGIVVGVVLLAFGETEIGVTVLLSAATGAGLTWRVPNSQKP